MSKREIRKYPSGEKVWVGKFKNSQNVEHWHTDGEIIFVESGEIDVICGENAYILQKGNAMYIDSEQNHRMCYRTVGTVIYIIIFDYSLIANFAKDITISDPLFLEGDCVAESYEKLFRFLKEKPQFYTAETEMELVHLVLHLLRQKGTMPKPKQKNTTEELKKLLKKMSDDYRFITFDDAVKFMGMSPAYFSRFFKKMTGMRFCEYLCRLRIGKAVELLQKKDGTPVTEIADLCGFTTIRNFNKTFLAATGFAPTKLPEKFVFVTADFDDGSLGDPTSKISQLIETP